MSVVPHLFTAKCWHQRQHFPKMFFFFLFCKSSQQGLCYTVKQVVIHHTHLPIAHKCGVFSHQDVRSEEEDEGVTETQQSPVQERPERQQRVLADVPEG